MNWSVSRAGFLREEGELGFLSPCHHFLVCDDRWEQVIPGPASLGNSGLMVLIAFGGRLEGRGL